MKKILQVVLVFSLLFVTGCTAKTKDNKDNDGKIDEPIVEEPKEEPKLKIINPESTTRPIAVMINNHNVARPYHSGLQEAFIVYEMVVEAGITRYLALFQDTNTARIGSVRSARHDFLDYALENDAIFVHHGQSPQAKNDFSKLGIDRIEVGEPKTAWRDTKLNVAWEHKLFTSIEKIKLGLGNRRTERNKEFLLNYSIGEINIDQMPDAQVANDISIKYSAVITNRYEYDSLTKVYKRFVNGVEHKDYITGNQYTFKNIIVVQVGNYAIDNYGRQEIDNIGEYRGYYITNGSAVPIIAKKESRSSQTIYQYLDGTEITVNDGNTFIQIQPKNQPLLMS